MISALPAARFTLKEWRFRRLYHKYRQYTMIPEISYADNLRLSANVAAVEGSIVECGTWRGGMIAGIAEILGKQRRYYLCDSFQGLPLAKEIDGDAARAWQADTKGPWYHDNCRASEEDAKAAMLLSGANDYKILRGWFEETLPRFPREPIALLRMDADWYDSTKCILENLAHRVVPGGLIVIDDYYTWEGCTLAVNEFAVRNKWQIRQSRFGVCYVVA
jgi:O-methyltransferase